MPGDSRCPLGELPLDVFKTLLDNVIDTIGVTEGARLRLICSTLYLSSIYEQKPTPFPELFDREIPGALYRCPDFKLSDADWSPARPKVAEKYVLYRALADGKRKHNLSAHLHRILEELFPGQDYFSDVYQDALRSLVTTAVYQDYGDAHIVDLIDSRKSPMVLDSSTFRRDCLRAAAVLGVIDKFNEVILDAASSEHQRQSGDGMASVFCKGPLVYAAIGGHLLLIARILDAREAASYTSDLSEVHFAFRAAITGGFTHIVELLLDRCETDSYMRLTRFAAQANQARIFHILCERLQTPLDDFRSLCHAARHGHINFVKMCLTNGANVNANATSVNKMWQQESPLFLACSGGYRDVVQLLLDHGAMVTDYMERWSSLSRAASHGHYEIVQDLLAAGSIPVHNYAWSPLMAAVRNGQARSVEVLLDSGMELWYKNQALETAAERGYDTVVRLLVQRGANIDYDGKSATFPMIAAMLYCQPHIVRTLLELGAKLAGPFPISNYSGVVEQWKYPRLEMI
ncbi:hypothetical protein ONS95_004253 [Cadophora gregata]|uniref:uncharacterized protein n=1 Tax=Cadophora gregata TaxID=51156 RepID=UPI0026DAFF2B|nr:uncharacterized protein ONS95_004253 [Cadophora gregata]KAK0105371.1 hypothetical protein ONS96_004763 [Cadophora gregata f. sp. sojae]KAK0105732.1 hypothetical protein ONS95_004253 [Cadophora gregata]